MFHDLLQRACVTSHVHFKLHSFPEVKNHKTPSAEMHAGRGANVRTKRKEEGGGGNSGPSAKVCLLLCGRQEGRRWMLATTYSVPGTELGAPTTPGRHIVISHFTDQETGPESGSHGPKAQNWEEKSGWQEGQPLEQGSPLRPGAGEKRKGGAGTRNLRLREDITGSESHAGCLPSTWRRIRPPGIMGSGCHRAWLARAGCPELSPESGHHPLC